MRPAAAFAVIFLVTLILRLCHKDVVWVEEGYPIAAALEILRGKVIYRDFWFDKPPLFAWFYTWFGAAIGWKLRLAGTMVVTFSSWCAWLLGRELWGDRAGVMAAGLLAFFLAFDTPSAMLPVAPDMLLIAPHLLAILFCIRNKPLLAGMACGVGLLVNPKVGFVLSACLLWQWRKAHWLAAGVLLVNAPVLTWLQWNGAMSGYLEQVWEWGALYSRDTFVDNPLWEGARRTSGWIVFHVTLVAGAALWRWKDPSSQNRRLLLWILVSFLGVATGLRFFPRYYFLLLAPMVVVAAGGFVLQNKVRWLAFGLFPWFRFKVSSLALALLLIPWLRFFPGYVRTAAGNRGRDLALHDDARMAAEFLTKNTKSESLLLWGYRPEVYAYSRLPAATPWLDSQPLTGVIADRHLVSSKPSAPELGMKNRTKLVAYEPDAIVDGLGPLNPALAITQYPELQSWLARYKEVMRNKTVVVYVRLKATDGNRALP